MAQWIALDPTAHRYSGWRKPPNAAFTAADATVPVLQGELDHLLPDYPLVFVQQAATDPPRYTLLGLQSLLPGRNSLVDAMGRWTGRYMPAYYRSYPFQRSVAEDGQLILCIDAASDLLPIDSGYPDLQPLFTGDRQPSAALQPILNFLQTCHQDGQLTQQLIDQLSALDLITPWPIPNLATGSGEIEGFYRIDESRLRALPAEQLTALAQSGALRFAYSQILSQPRLSTLQGQVSPGAQPASELSFDNLFGAEDDTLHFDFDR